MLEIYGYIIRSSNSNRMVIRTHSGRELGYDAKDSHSNPNDYDFFYEFDNYPDGGVKFADTNRYETYPPEFQMVAVCDEYYWHRYVPFDREAYMLENWPSWGSWQEKFPYWPAPYDKSTPYTQHYYFDFYTGDVGNAWRTIDGATKDGYGFLTGSGYDYNQNDDIYTFIDTSVIGNGDDYFNNDSKYRLAGTEVVFFMLPSGNTSKFIYNAETIATFNSVEEWGPGITLEYGTDGLLYQMFHDYEGFTQHMVEESFLIPNNVEPGWHTFEVTGNYFQLDLKVKLITSEGERDFTFTTDYDMALGANPSEYAIGDKFLKIFIGQVESIEDAFAKNFKS